MFDWLKSRRKFKTAAYSLELGNFSRECLDATYREGSNRLVFSGERVGKQWEQVNLRAPSNLGEKDMPQVLGNVSEALENLGYAFLIFRSGVAEPIPAEEQQAAIAGLREMGMEPRIAPDGSKVELKKIPGWQRPPEFDPKAQALKMMRLVRTARGKRSQIEVLAKSKTAVVDFI